MYELALTELAPMLSVLGLTRTALERERAALFPPEGFRCVYA